MLDRYYIKPGGGNMSAYLNVNEYRAPTDQSVQLLKDLESAAAKKIRDVIVVDGNELKGKILILENDPFTRNSVVYFIFDLNGVEYEFNEYVKVGLETEPDSLVRKLYEFVSKAVAEQLLLKLDKNAINDYVGWYRTRHE